jgi:NADH-quinone oxidoreductase subunit N
VIALFAEAKISGPKIDWEAISPIVALTAAICIVLLVGLARAPFIRTRAVPLLTILGLGVTIGLCIWQWGENELVISRALAMDDFTRVLTLFFCAAGILTVGLAWRSAASAEAGEGEFYALLLSSILGMVILVAAENFVVLFVGFELLSIPLYVLCATHMRREHSLESGLKYLIIGSVGSATLLYGLALLYGATGSTDFTGVAAVAGDVRDDALFMAALALVVAGLAFKASVAPFHQWTPDVYEGAPTPVTAFMAVATKAAAFGVLLRLFDVALIGAASTWAPALAALAAFTIVIGNVGALGQSSLKRMLAYSSVAQAGYMLVGVVVSTRLGVQATIFYLGAYLVMNIAAFAVIAVRERETDTGDDISSMYGLGAARPALAWPMTIAMLSLAGFPATAGFFGKLFLIQAAVDNEYAWLGVAIVLGSAISLVYYLRVIAAVWMRSPSEVVSRVRLGAGAPRPVIAGGSPEADEPGSHAAGPGDGSESGSGSARGAGRERGERSPGDHGVEGQGPAEGDAPPGEGPRERIGAEDEGTSDPVDVSAQRSAAAEAAAEPMRGIRTHQYEVAFVALVCAVVTVALGVYPDPLLDLARDAADSIRSLV